MSTTLRTVPVFQEPPKRKKRKAVPSVVRRLEAVGAIGGQAGGGTLYTLAKADRPAVECPRGEPAVARALAARYGASRVVLVFEDGTASERTRKGTARDGLSAMARFLVEGRK